MVNFNDTVPAAPSGEINIKWRRDSSGNVSASYVPASTDNGPWTQDQDAAGHDLFGVDELYTVGAGVRDWFGINVAAGSKHWADAAAMVMYPDNNDNGVGFSFSSRKAAGSAFSWESFPLMFTPAQVRIGYNNIPKVSVVSSVLEANKLELPNYAGSGSAGIQSWNLTHDGSVFRYKTNGPGLAQWMSNGDSAFRIGIAASGSTGGVASLKTIHRYYPDRLETATNWWLFYEAAQDSGTYFDFRTAAGLQRWGLVFEKDTFRVFRSDNSGIGIAGDPLAINRTTGLVTLNSEGAGLSIKNWGIAALGGDGSFVGFNLDQDPGVGYRYRQSGFAYQVYGTTTGVFRIRRADSGTTGALATTFTIPFEIDASGVTSISNLNKASLGSGTPNSTTFLRGDGVWAVPPAGSGSGSQTPWTQDVDAAGFKLFNAGSLELRGDTTIIRSGLKKWVYGDGGGAGDGAFRLTRWYDGGASEDIFMVPKDTGFARFTYGIEIRGTSGGADTAITTSVTSAGIRRWADGMWSTSQNNAWVIARYDVAGGFRDFPLSVDTENGYIWLNNGFGNNLKIRAYSVYPELYFVDTTGKSLFSIYSNPSSGVHFRRYDPATGNLLSTPIQIDQGTGAVSIASNLIANGNIQSPLDTNNKIGHSFNLTWDGTNHRYIATGFGGVFRFTSDGGFRMAIAPSGSAGGVATTSDYFIIRTTTANLKTDGMTWYPVTAGSAQLHTIATSGFLSRWAFGMSADTANNFEIHRYTGASVWQDVPFVINNATGSTYIKLLAWTDLSEKIRYFDSGSFSSSYSSGTESAAIYFKVPASGKVRFYAGTVPDGGVTSKVEITETYTRITNLTKDSLGSGTPNATTFLRGDGTWAVPAGGGSQTPWTSDIDAAGFKLSNLGDTRINGDVSLDYLKAIMFNTEWNGTNFVYRSTGQLAFFNTDANGLTLTMAPSGAAGSNASPSLVAVARFTTARTTFYNAIAQPTTFSPTVGANGWNGGILIREVALAGITDATVQASPRIGFLWQNWNSAGIGYHPSEGIRTFDAAGTGYAAFVANNVTAKGNLTVNGNMNSSWLTLHGWNVYHDGTDYRYTTANPGAVIQPIGTETIGVYTSVSGAAGAIATQNERLYLSPTISRILSDTFQLKPTLGQAGAIQLYSDSNILRWDVRITGGSNGHLEFWRCNDSGTPQESALTLTRTGSVSQCTVRYFTALNNVTLSNSAGTKLLVTNTLGVGSEGTPNFMHFTAPINAGYRWYINATPDGGTSDKMELTAGLLTLTGVAPVIATSNAPATATATGITGQVAWDTGFIYVCTATNTWKRAALSTW